MAVSFLFGAALLATLVRGDPPVSTGICTDCQRWGFNALSSNAPFGPGYWNQLPNAQCGGSQQSPINISPKDVVIGVTLDQLLRSSYSRFGSYVWNTGYDVRLAGRTLNTAIGDVVTFRGKSYTLMSVQFHVPGSHTINFQTYDFELHLVHQWVDTSVTPPRRLPGFFIMAVLAQLTSGDSNAALAQACDLIPQLPPNVTSFMKISGAGVPISGLLPDNMDYFYYQGSLPYPPCTELVEWAVLMNPILAPTKCRDNLQSIISSTYAAASPGNNTSFNSRPVQPVFGRSVAYSGTLPFVLPGILTQNSSSQLNITMILVAVTLGVIGLGILVIVSLVYRSLRKNNSEDNIPLHPLAE